MWKEYVINSIQNSKATSISIVAAAFISSTMLSLLCGILYNMWADDVQNSYTNATLSGAVYTAILLLAGITLILIIHNAFAVSMNAKIRQIGLLQSIGATPRQTRAFLLYEAFLLSAPPVIAGTGLGTGLNYLFMRFIIALSQDIILPLRETELRFHVHPFVIILTVVAAFLTVHISAWIPARKLSKISPLEAIRAGDGQEIKKVRKFCMLSKISGIEGELTRKSLYARRRAFRMSSLSLLLAFFVYSAFVNMDTISSLSTQRTYFESLAIEERIEALENDQKIRGAYRLVMSGLCGFVALIGMANVFSNALGRVYQRKREFARYASIGMPPAGVRKMLILEALLISLKPIMVGILMNTLFVAWGLRAASIPASDYFQHMPLSPIAIFALLIMLLIGLAYFIGGHQIGRQNIVDALRDDVLF